MAARSLLTVWLALIAGALATELPAGYRLAKRVDQTDGPELAKRGSSIGGWALSALSCPSNTTACDSGKSGSCCPTALKCYDGESGGAGTGWDCCPGNDCTQLLLSAPVCADPSWVAYHGSYSWEYFCCQQGDIGALGEEVDGNIGTCLPAGSKNVQSTATSLVPTSVPSGSAGSASSVLSSLLSIPTGTATTGTIPIPSKTSNAIKSAVVSAITSGINSATSAGSVTASPFASLSPLLVALGAAVAGAFFFAAVV
ncbi:MAG: hypothetical protein M1838_000545 [Thelocarpon superellum]|nr:MAG: hypothetical protein M1838_000545 [Thelocarpon superellum]